MVSIEYQAINKNQGSGEGILKEIFIILIGKIVDELQDDC